MCTVLYQICVTLPLLHFAVDCGELSAPDNGGVLQSGTGLGAIATYSCRDGFNRIGTSSRTCQANGQWSGEEPTCSSMYLNSTAGLEAIFF